MGRNFDDYSGFQPKTTPAQRYATQCINFNRQDIEKMFLAFLNNVPSLTFFYILTALSLVNGDYDLFWWMAIRILGNLFPKIVMHSIKDGKHISVQFLSGPI